VKVYDLITRILNLVTGTIGQPFDAPGANTGPHGAFVEGIKRGWNWLHGGSPAASAPIPSGGTTPGGSGVSWDPAKSGFTDPAAAAAAAIIRRSEGSTTDVNNYAYDRPGARWVGPGGVERGYTAGGFYQTLDTNWVKYARELGIDTKKYPRMHGAPQEMQDRVFQKMYQTEGPTPWMTGAGGSVDASRLAEIMRATRNARGQMIDRTGWSSPPGSYGSSAANRFIQEAEARRAAGQSTTTNHGDINIGDINVHTSATDPAAVAQAVKTSLQRSVTQANTGLE
jgi:hypothetical protein